MDLYNQIINKNEKIALVGLGYVGLPIAVAFAKRVHVIGFDLNKEKILSYQNGKDPTCEVGDEAIRQTTVDFTFEEKKLRESRFIIIAVPTPVNANKTPHLNPVEGALIVVGRNLRPGNIIVYESTVYPEGTENICVQWDH